jgi:hypothetical protein
MTITTSLRAVKRRARAVLRASRERMVLRGIAPNVLSYPAPNRADGAANGKPPTYLVTRYAYHAKDASMGESFEKFSLDKTIIAAGLGNVETYLWETDWRPFPRGDWALLEKCRAVTPKAIILNTYEPGYPLQPSIETIRLLRKVWKIPIIAIWWDTCYDGFWPSIVPVLPYVDVHVVLDNPLLYFLEKVDAGPYRQRFIGLWYPIDPHRYIDPGLPRDIDLAFLGQVAGYRSNRMQYVQYLMEHNMPVYFSGFNRAEQPSHDKYLEILRRTRIGLNFSASVNSDQLKMRILETMSSGALLMENDNAQTRCYFTPMRDYVSFGSPADLLDKVRYYLAHEHERLEIAARGKERFHAHYTSAHFWKAVMAKFEEVRNLPL